MSKSEDKGYFIDGILDHQGINPGEPGYSDLRGVYSGMELTRLQEVAVKIGAISESNESAHFDREYVGNRMPVDSGRQIGAMSAGGGAHVDEGVNLRHEPPENPAPVKDIDPASLSTEERAALLDEGDSPRRLLRPRAR